MLVNQLKSSLAVRSQWRSQPKNLRGRKIWGAKMSDFRRITLFCLEKLLSKYKMTICFKNLGAMARLAPSVYAYVRGSI